MWIKAPAMPKSNDIRQVVLPHSSFRLLAFYCFGPHTRLAVFKLQTSHLKEQKFPALFFLLYALAPTTSISDH